LDIDECKEPNNCVDEAACIYLPGCYYCTCPEGYGGDDAVIKPKQIISLNEYINCFPWNKSHLTVSVSVITLLNGSFYAYLALKKRNLKTYTTFQPSTPIIHRDVKTSNVLDHNLTAKFWDFRASRIVPLERSQITTLEKRTECILF
jgi:serine/threonine protein kinase